MVARSNRSKEEDRLFDQLLHGGPSTIVYVTGKEKTPINVELKGLANLEFKLPKTNDELLPDWGGESAKEYFLVPEGMEFGTTIRPSSHSAGMYMGMELADYGESPVESVARYTAMLSPAPRRESVGPRRSTPVLRGKGYRALRTHSKGKVPFRARRHGFHRNPDFKPLLRPEHIGGGSILEMIEAPFKANGQLFSAPGTGSSFAKSAQVGSYMAAPGSPQITRELDLRSPSPLSKDTQANPRAFRDHRKLIRHHSQRVVPSL